MKAFLILKQAGLMLGLAAVSAWGLRAESIVDSKHNLSANSRAAIRAATETEVCVFCHTPHHGTKEAPLWNHASAGTTYTPYGSSTTKARIGQPNGASKVCLSCHDGTVALGMVRGRSTPIPFQNKVVTLPKGRTSLGTDLSGEHPISFTFDSSLIAANPELRNPQTLDRKVKLDHAGQVQCTSCHDPHNNRFGTFLVQDNTGSALCVNCHNLKSWASSSHATSTKTWTGVGANPWPHTQSKTVAANGCENCHAPHAAGGKERLLNFAAAEQNCLSCHSGNVAAKNIAAELNKPSAHSVTLARNQHDPQENPLTAPRHVECADCHNPHASRPAINVKALIPGAVTRALSPAIASTKGINAGGALVKEISSEDELCYKCHADSVSKKQARIPRQFSQTNSRLQFSSANASFHPIQTSGRNPNVPSLIQPWRPSSRMQCTDCHNSDQGGGNGGTGPSGPHGSVFTPLLERQLVLTDNQIESPANYALCYKCHSRDSILADQSFNAVASTGQDRGHRFHVVDAQTACTTCHDPHGVTSARNLINFNLTYVQPLAGTIQYASTGASSGTCTLKCHGNDGKDHDHDHAAYGSLLSPSPLLKRRR